MWKRNSPAANRTWLAQPVKTSSCGSGMPSKNGWRLSTGCSVCTVTAILHLNGGNLCGDVNAHGAPGDAAAAADTARAAELIPPGRELVRHPLAVAGARGRVDAPSVDVRMGSGEAGVPPARPFGCFPGEVGCVLDGGAETGGTDHGAVAARQTAFGDLLPAGTVEIAEEQLPGLSGVEGPAHGSGRQLRHLTGPEEILLTRGMAGHGLHYPLTRFGSGLHQKFVTA